MREDGSATSATRLLPVVGRSRGRLSDLAERVPLASVYLLIITLVVFQRFVIPGTTVSVALPVAFLVLVGLAVRGQLVADVQRTGLYLAAVAACLLSSLVVTAQENLESSLTSLLFLAVLYIPFCFRTSPALRSQFPRVLEFFQTLMILAAFACVAQWAMQAVGVAYQDLFETYLPPELIYSRLQYNTTYPIYYGSSILKANGVVFLEASFASQFMALAIIIQLLFGNRRWRLVLFGAALLTTVSGTGFALLGVGLVVLAVRRGGRWTARAMVAVSVVAVAVSVTPVGDLLADRTGESSQTGSSGNARFVAPYLNVAEAIGRDQEAFLVGRGAGSIEGDDAFFNPGGVAVNYPALPKVIGEYGVPAALIFIAFVLTVFLRNVASTTLGLASAVVYFVLSGSLLQPQTVYLCWLLTGMFAAARAGEVAGRRHRLPAGPTEMARPWPQLPAPRMLPRALNGRFPVGAGGRAPDTD